MTPDRGPSILFVCTANVCRSPMAAALMDHHARHAGIEPQITSASVDDERRRVHPMVVQILDDRGLKPCRTQSQPLSRQLVDGSDLILTMTSEHAIAVAGRYRDARTKVFMLSDFVEIARPKDSGELLDDWLADITAQPRFYGANVDERDIHDPMGGDEALFRSIAHRIDELTERFAALIAPLRA